MGKAPQFKFFKREVKVYLGPQGLSFLQLKRIHMPKWFIVERPVLNPFRELK